MDVRWFVLAAALVASCSSREPAEPVAPPAKQTYAEMMQILTAERQELDRIEAQLVAAEEDWEKEMRTFDPCPTLKLAGNPELQGYATKEYERKRAALLEKRSKQRQRVAEAETARDAAAK